MQYGRAPERSSLVVVGHLGPPFDGPQTAPLRRTTVFKTVPLGRSGNPPAHTPTRDGAGTAYRAPTSGGVRGPHGVHWLCFRLPGPSPRSDVSRRSAHDPAYELAGCGGLCATSKPTSRCIQNQGIPKVGYSPRSSSEDRTLLLWSWGLSQLRPSEPSSVLGRHSSQISFDRAENEIDTGARRREPYMHASWHLWRRHTAG